MNTQAHTVTNNPAAADIADVLFEVALRGMPRNGATGKAYKGGNVLALWEVAAEEGFSSNVWLTFNQARELGGNVRKGSSGVQCRYYGAKNAQGQESGDEGSKAEGEGDASSNGRTSFRGRPFYVFNLNQIDNLPELAALPTDEEEGLSPVDFLIESLERMQERAGGLQ